MSKRSSRSQLAAFLLSLAGVLGVVACQSSGCVVAEPHITLGDYFRLEQSGPDNNHLYTVGCTVTSECTTLPLLVLTGKDSRGTSLAEVQINHFEKKDINLNISNSEYKKSGLFFRVTTDQLNQGYSSWELRLNGARVHTQETFPQKARANDDNTRLFIIADMDNTATAEPTWTKLDKIVPTEFDMIMHIGDFAYEIYDNGGKFGDEYFTRSSKSSRRIPFVMTPGNHENYANGTLLNYRFRMPTAPDASNAMYDFVYKGVYFMFVTLDWVLSYEPWTNIEYAARERQLLAWIDSRAKLFNARKDIKWKVFGSHRPFECSDRTASDCQTNMLFFRRIADKVAQVGFHFSINAHIHSYVRNKVSHALEILPMSRIGKGAFMTVINGHAGTAYYYQTEASRASLTGPLVETLDVSGPTFLQLELSSTSIVGKLTRSDNGEVRDTFSITEGGINQKPDSSGSPWLFISVVVVGSIILLGAVVLIWAKREALGFKSVKGYTTPTESDIENSHSSI